MLTLLTITPQVQVHLNFKEVFTASPFIYTLLGALSVLSIAIWLYSMLTLKLSELMPHSFLHQVKEQLLEKRFESALLTCQQGEHFSSSIIACGIAARKHGPQVMMEIMQAEGRRLAGTLWQRISILNDIAVVAPMLGLLGTVLGMFYAFYDIHRTQETMATIFDGLGISIGTTVGGLVVAIMSMLFHTTLKYRVTRILNTIENEALSLGNLIEA